MKSPSLASVMTPFPYSVAPGASLSDARGMLTAHGIHHLPVTDGTDILGVISQGDVSLAISLCAEGEEEPRVSAVYIKEPYVVEIYTPLSEVTATMATRRRGCAIVTRHGRLAGILTHTDVCRVLSQLLEPPGGGQTVA